MTLPTLTTPQLVIDAPRVSDARGWSDAQDEECAHWFDWPGPPGLERCRAYLDSLQEPEDNIFVWAIRRGPELVGGIDLKLIDDDWNVSYFVAPAARGQHIAREALAAVTHWAFDTLKLNSITTTVHADNIASRKVLESVGFTLTGRRDDEAVCHEVISYHLSTPHITDTTHKGRACSRVTRTGTDRPTASQRTMSPRRPTGSP